MSSLFSKLKALVNASVRGPRRYKRESEPRSETAKGAHPVPEVTETPTRRRKLPEVTEAPQVESAEVPVRPAATSTSQPATQFEDSETDETHTDTLEEERVADLLKGKRS
jgi:hypothetical protein